MPTGRCGRSRATADNDSFLRNPEAVAVDQTAEVQLAGAAPGFSGLTQINIAVPANVGGTVPVKVTVGGVPLNQGTITL
jgi:uncharacterized protein (TIGR03437 family)